MNKAVAAEVITIGGKTHTATTSSKFKISHVHCELTIIAGGFFISDLGTVNGVFIKKGKRFIKVKNAWVKPNQKLMLGGVILSLRDLLKSSNTACDKASRFIAARAGFRLKQVFLYRVALLWHWLKRLKSNTRAKLMVIITVIMLLAWTFIAQQETYVVNKQATVIVFKDKPQITDFEHTAYNAKLYSGDEVKILAVKQSDGYLPTIAKVEVAKGSAGIEGRAGWVLRRDLGNR